MVFAAAEHFCHARLRLRRVPAQMTASAFAGKNSSQYRPGALRAARSASDD
jgi:hypothetical protein